MFGLLLRVVAVEKDTCFVEHVPSGRTWRSDAVGTIQKAPKVAEGGFRWRFAHDGPEQVLTAGPERIAEWLMLDERARGWTVLRARAVGEATAGLPEGAALETRLLDYLEGSDEWGREGTGAERGFVRGGHVRDWRERWIEAELPVGFAGGEKIQDEDAAVAALRLLCEATAPDLPFLGRVRTTRWLPPTVRAGALERLVAVWKETRRRTGFRQVREEALLHMLKDSPDLAESMAREPAVSLAVRKAAVEQLKDGDEAIRSVIREVSRPANKAGAVRVAGQLAALAESPAVIVECVAACMSNRADAEITKETADLLDERLETLDRTPLLLEAARGALAGGALGGAVRDWLNLLGGDAAVWEIAEAWGTVHRLRGEGGLAALSITTPELEAGFTRWIEQALALRDDWEAPGALPSLKEGSFAQLVKGHAEGARLTRNLEWFTRTVGALAELVARIHAENGLLLAKVDDKQNAERVLRGDDVERIRADRGTLLASARDEVADERRAERRTVAKILAEVQTAVGRTREATPATALDALERRMVELAARLDMTFVGRVGERAPSDPALHQLAAGVASEGTIRSVGIRDVHELLVKGKIGPLETN
ncbi:MAG: hypothetical protein V4850_17795 [Myxococcota bacterium]